MYDCGCHAAHLHPAYIFIVAGALSIHFEICCHIVVASEVLQAISSKWISYGCELLAFFMSLCISVDN